ncbi:polyketide cyclase [Chitinophaga sp. SYP-B3965]|uniref:SRPBCC family protein n=1 Tax=Chitinophaga sp. SYP-B3965 TaxID=2663120 RepID=UPI001299E65F|nr:SRPBCC family protein [Chitinophaga sp. SYP-B3965]MRG47213.1 polyketide cyclase [Chitinophaga sp. SYP-B3965]
MSILITAFTILIGIILLLLIIALFIKKEYTIERVVVINKPKTVVYDYLRLLRNHNNFIKWALIDPNMKKEYRGTDGTVGFVSTWDSENKQVGKGEQEIIKIQEGEKIDYELRFIRPFEGTSYASIANVAVGEQQTRVIWVFNGKMKYPMNLMLLFMNLEKMLSRDLDEGLAKLKTILEK